MREHTRALEQRRGIWARRGAPGVERDWMEDTASKATTTAAPRENKHYADYLKCVCASSRTLDARADKFYVQVLRKAGRRRSRRRTHARRSRRGCPRGGRSRCHSLHACEESRSRRDVFVKTPMRLGCNDLVCNRRRLEFHVQPYCATRRVHASARDRAIPNHSRANTYCVSNASHAPEIVEFQALVDDVARLSLIHI